MRRADRRVPATADDAAPRPRAAARPLATGCGSTPSARRSTSRSPRADVRPAGRALGRREARALRRRAGRAREDGQEAPRDARALRGRRDRRRRRRDDGARPRRRSPGSSRGSCSTSPPPTATTRNDPMRPAEALVLFELLRRPVRPRGARSTGRLDRRRGLHRLASSSATRRWRCGSRSCSASRSARKLAGRVIPGVAIVFNAIGNERRTRAARRQGDPLLRRLTVSRGRRRRGPRRRSSPPTPRRRGSG